MVMKKFIKISMLETTQKLMKIN